MYIVNKYKRREDSMKKLLLVIVITLFTFSLVGCGGSNNQNEDSNLPNIKSTLEAEGYEFTQRDADAISYYNQNAVNDVYSVDLDVTDLYIAYINGSTGWLEMIQFSSTAQATEFTQAIDNVDTSGMLYYQDGPVVVITYRQETIDALN